MKKLMLLVAVFMLGTASIAFAQEPVKKDRPATEQTEDKNAETKAEAKEEAKEEGKAEAKEETKTETKAEKPATEKPEAETPDRPAK
ncbi:MAG: hypothetical protein LBF17_04615 [Mediterranea sp.]|jgi:Ni/Co efflux regulator RcnB|nr:hypothetical protein [Mediterranea sp.]